MKHILIVEDSVMIGKLLKKKIESKFKVPVIITKTLQETVDVLSQKEIRISEAVLDLGLPDAPDGEVIDVVGYRGIPSIVFTGSIDENMRETVWKKKVADYILKDDKNGPEYVITALKRLRENKHTKILVVDASSFFRRMISELLVVQQFQVVTANNGLDGLKILKENPDIKLIITDYAMPKMNGDVLCKKIRLDFSKEDLAIIGISSEEDSKMAAQFIKSGANDFIVKQSFIIEEFYCRVFQCIENIDLIMQVREAAIKDYLTGLYNRRYFYETGKTLFETSKKNAAPLSCAMLDIDYFKKVNDTHGHDVGDLVLKQISSIIQDMAGETNLVARLGGEEFCVLAPETNHSQAKIIFDKMHREIEGATVKFNDNKESLNVTVSVGVCSEPPDDLDLMVKKADELLYKAKQTGRNRVLYDESQ